MELCINTCSIGATPRGPWGIARQLDAVRSSPFRSVGLDVATVRPFLDAGSTLAELRAMLDEREISCLEVHVLRCFPEGSDALAADDEVAFFVRMASELGAPWVNVTIDAAPDAGRVAQMRRFANRLSEVGSAVSLEYQPGFACDTIATAREWRDEVAGVGVQVDTWHTFRSDSTLDEVRALPADGISFVQFGDGSTADAQAGGRRLPGQGDFPLREFVRAVRATGFDGLVQIETFVPELMQADPEYAARVQFEVSSPFWTDR